MNNVKYFYIRQDNANTLRRKEANFWGNFHSDYEHHRGDPIACVAYTPRDATGLVKWALSTVNQKHDKFDKAEARKRAEAGLNYTDSANVVTLNELQTKSSDVAFMVIRKLAAEDWVPSSVKKAAKAWLSE